jgi:Mrp family chromosome partitioning ATPase
MLRRGSKQEVLARVPAPAGGGSRSGALGRTELAAYSDLATALGGAGAVFVTGPAGPQVALGLAATELAEGRRVALLEADLATPALADALGLAARPGFAEYLRGEAEAAQVVQPLVLAGPASGRAVEPLACIVAGEPELAPVSLLDSERCDHAISRLRRAYDLLVIDGPPLEEEPDSLQALAEHAGATIVAGERGEIPKRLPVPVVGQVLVNE